MKMKPLLALVALLVTFLLYLALTTFPFTGTKAIQRMSESEKALLAKLQSISKGMPYSDVVALLGQPDRDGGGLRPTWKIEGSSTNQVSVYLSDGGVRKVRWMKLGSFVWEQ